MAKILACCALCLALVAGWQYSQTQAESAILCGVSGQEIDPVEEELRVKYPEVFKQPCVVGFGAEWCRYCPAQKAHLRALAARGYRVAYFDIDDHPELFEFLGGKVEGESVPYVVVFVKGKIEHSFEGLTYWRKIAKVAKECLIDYDADIDIRIGPWIWIRV